MSFWHDFLFFRSAVFRSCVFSPIANSYRAQLILVSYGAISSENILFLQKTLTTSYVKKTKQNKTKQKNKNKNKKQKQKQKQNKTKQNKTKQTNNKKQNYPFLRFLCTPVRSQSCGKCMESEPPGCFGEREGETVSRRESWQPCTHSPRVQVKKKKNMKKMSIRHSEQSCKKWDLKMFDPCDCGESTKNHSQFCPWK